MKTNWLSGCIIIIIVVLCLGVVSQVSAQAGKLPPFRITLHNGKPFKAEELPMGKPIVLIYFSPDCDHCDKMTAEMVKQQAKFKNASVAMVTYLPVAQMTSFVKKHKLANFPNFYVGTEGTSFFLRKYYRLTRMPFLALYTKNGDLVQSYTNEEGFPQLVKQLTSFK